MTERGFCIFEGFQKAMTLCKIAGSGCTERTFDSGGRLGSDSVSLPFITIEVKNLQDSKLQIYLHILINLTIFHILYNT